jgi:hypothetical protein
MSLRTVTATRYVTPLREGGSLPAIVEADDDGLYVLKFRGAGQGPRALVAEVIAGELARAAGLKVPEIVRVELDADMARTEPDPEIQALIRASAGTNVGLDYLPGSVMFDPVAEKPEAALASSIVWLDAYVTNIDRTARNVNLLTWHRALWLIDHGAALYFHHAEGDYRERIGDRFPQVKQHVLLPFANALGEADRSMPRALEERTIRSIVDAVPQAWLEGGLAREAYVDYLTRRLQAPRAFAEEAQRAHDALHV